MKKEVAEKFSRYPAPVRKKLELIRTLIVDEINSNDLGEFEETLKWGEPSYLVEGGSTVRFDWKEKSPDEYAIYFNCNTNLVDTFKVLYADEFRFDGNRAIVIGLNEDFNKQALAHCIHLSLTYHKVKHLALLGA